MVRTLISNIVALIIMVLAFALPVRADSRFLDATKPIIPLQPGQESEPNGVWFPLKPTVEQSLDRFIKLRLVKLNRSEYRRMERVVYEVAIENITNRTILIPWSPNPIARRERPIPGYRTAVFYLQLVAENYLDFIVGSFSLYGAPDIPNSLKRLPPGDKVVVRLPATLTGNGLHDKTNPVLNPPSDLRASVELELYARDDSTPFLHGNSENTLPIRIRQSTRKPKEAAFIGPPVIDAVEPNASSADCALFLSLHGMSDDLFEKTTIIFSNNGTNLRAETGNATYKNNDTDGGYKWVVYVPHDVTPGVWRISARTDEGTSRPISILLSDRVLPEMNWISPEHANPGETVVIKGKNFRRSDQVEIVSEQGSAYAPNACGAWPDHCSFELPLSISEGRAAVRILTTFKTGEILRSEPLFLNITSAPLALHSWDFVESVAPGQWTSLEVLMTKVLRTKERNESHEFEFTQGRRIVKVRISSATFPFVRIPKKLDPGRAEVRTRTWQGGKASEWSEAITYNIAAQPVAPTIKMIAVGNGIENIVVSERTDGFEARPGDELTFFGNFHLIDLKKLRLILQGTAGKHQLKGEKIDEFRFRVRLPGNLPLGTWRLTLSTPDSEAILPVSMSTF